MDFSPSPRSRLALRSLQPQSSLSRTRNWIASLSDTSGQSSGKVIHGWCQNTKVIEGAVPMEQGQKPSPVSHMTGIFSSQTLLDSTPRRRLSLDASSSESSTSPNDKLQANFSIGTPTLASRAPAHKLSNGAECSSLRASVSSCPALARLPSLRLPICSSSRETDVDDIRSILSCVSPTPSSVFDEETASSCGNWLAPASSTGSSAHLLSAGGTFIRKRSYDITNEKLGGAKNNMNTDNSMEVDILPGSKSVSSLMDLITGPLLSDSGVSSPLPRSPLTTIHENVPNSRTSNFIKRSKPVKVAKRKMTQTLLEDGMPGLRVVKRSSTSLSSSKCIAKPGTSEEDSCSPPHLLKKCKETILDAEKENASPFTLIKRKHIPLSENNRKAGLVVRSQSESCFQGAFHNKYEETNLNGDYSQKLSLPTIISKDAPNTKAISGETLASVMRGDYSSTIKKYVLIDCRFPYEYSGGHIRGALNLHKQDVAQAQFLGSLSQEHKDQGIASDTVLIFYCEYSQQRGPRMYSHLRKCDRNLNSEYERYPDLHFPNLYLLEGGYKKFYASFKELCDPLGYTPMDSKPEELKKFRKEKGKSKSFASFDAPSRRASALSSRGLFHR